MQRGAPAGEGEGCGARGGGITSGDREQAGFLHKACMGSLRHGKLHEAPAGYSSLAQMPHRGCSRAACMNGMTLAVRLEVCLAGVCV